MRYGINASRTALAILFAALAVRVFPQPTALANLDEIAAAGRKNSIDYAKALLAAKKAEANVPDLIKVKSSTLTGSYAYSGSASVSDATTDGVTASIDVPIVDQISLSASFSSERASKISTTVKPLSHADTRTQAQIAYEKALAAANEAGRSAGFTAVKAALKWMSLKRQLETQRMIVANKGEAYQAAKDAYDLDPKNYDLDDVADALKEWSSARATFIKLQSSERTAAAELRPLLGSTATEGDPVDVLSMEQISEALTNLKTSLSGAESSGAVDGYSVITASLDLRSAASTAAATWFFDPDLSISAGFSFPKRDDPVPSLSISLKLSLDDLQGKAVSRAREEVVLAGKALAMARSSQVNDYVAAVAAVQAAAVAVEGQKVSRSQASEIRAEAAFLFAQGSYSELENESAALALAQAEDALYQALVDEYSAWLDLAALAGK